MLKITTLLFVLFLAPPLISANPDLTIDGLIHDQVISRVGQLFYESFVSGWDVPEFDGNITVHERPDNFAGNVIWVEVNDISVYESRIGFRPNGIEDKAMEARELIEHYILEHKKVLQQLESI